MSRLIRPSLLLIAVLALAACASAATPAPREITVEAREFAYTPKEITVAQDEAVKITFSNAGTLTHEWSITEIDVTKLVVSTHEHTGEEHVGSYKLHTAAAPGNKTTIGFTPTKAGTYEYFCTVPGHADSGMRGTLIVTAPSK